MILSWSPKIHICGKDAWLRSQAPKFFYLGLQAIRCYKVEEVSSVPRLMEEIVYELIAVNGESRTLSQVYKKSAEATMDEK